MKCLHIIFTIVTRFIHVPDDVFSLQRYGLFFIANVQLEVQPLLVTEFLHRVVDVFRDYFNEVSEESIKENFITVYQLMDEMMDNGIPMTTEPNVLKTMIVPPTILGRVATSMG